MKQNQQELKYGAKTSLKGGIVFLCHKVRKMNIVVKKSFWCVHVEKLWEDQTPRKEGIP